MARSSVNVLSLCAGAGGLDLGVRMAVPAARTVCYVEIEAYACEVLASRMEEGRLDAAPIWTDLRTFDCAPWRGLVDLVIGGYPCQPFSVAGKRLGADDPRHLWPHVARIVRELAPAACFFENVSGHVSKGLREVRCELEDMGYRVEAEIVRAEEVGAPHRRERVFILAYADRGQLRNEPRWRSGTDGAGAPESRDDGEAMADAPSNGWLEIDGAQQGEDRSEHADRRSAGSESILFGGDEWPPGPNDESAWSKWNGPQPAVRRGTDGLAYRVDRLRLGGNGVVPQQAAYALRCLMERSTRRGD